jgi:hypothetical protein
MQGNLRSRRRRSGSLYAGRLGGSVQRAASAPDRGSAQACSIREQDSCRRYAGSGTRSWQRQDQDWPPLDLCARRTASRRNHPGRRVVRRASKPQRSRHILVREECGVCSVCFSVQQSDLLVYTKPTAVQTPSLHSRQYNPRSRDSSSPIAVHRSHCGRVAFSSPGSPTSGLCSLGWK